MKPLILIMALILIPSLCSADWIDDRIEDWSVENTAGQVIWYTLHGLDWGQTRKIPKHPDRYHETNPRCTGKHPDRQDVDDCFIWWAVAQTAVVFLAPQEVDVFGLKVYPRYMIQGLSIGGSGKNVYLNWRLMKEW